MKYAPNVKHLPKDKGTEAVIFAGSKAWEMAKAYQKNNSDDDVPPVVLDHQQLSELENLNIIDKGRMFARVYQAGIIDQACISQILQKLAKAKVKQAQLYNEAGELLEDWTPQLQEITTSQRTVIHSHDSATPALNQMGASQRGQVLLAHYGGELAIDSDSDTVHHYNG
ncbi:DNA primase family protein, partial [Yersinia enterocolitica]